jgi:hypothetical protein
MIRRSLVLISGLLLLGAASAQAQASFILDATIPFAFQAGSRTFPAGEYTLTVDGFRAPGVLTIRSRQGHEHEFVLTEPAATNHPKPDARLVFEHDGDDYVLSEVFDGGARRGLEVLGAYEQRLGVKPTD